MPEVIETATTAAAGTAQDILARFNRIRKEAVTKLNALGALLALYALSNQDISEKVLGFVPEQYRVVAGAVLPLLWFWLVQKGKEIDRAKTVAATEDKVINELVTAERNG